MSRVITFITGNSNKLREVQEIMGPDFKFEQNSTDLPELQGEPEEVAKTKCEAAARQVSGAVLVEDTSLCFNALKGLPGPYIKWFLKNLGPDGLPKLLEGFGDKTAYAQCIFAYKEPEKPVQLLIGRNQGSIVKPRGSRNFGWDPIFQPDGYNQTYAELDSSVKNGISHRRKALDQLKAYLEAESSNKK